MKARYWIPLLILAILIGARIYLPYWLTDNINETIEEIDGFSGSIQGVDMSLIRGAAGVDSLVIYQDNLEDAEPFLTIDRMSLNMDWGAVFRGVILANVLLEKPRINFIAGTLETEPQTGAEVDWAEALREMTPARINQFAIREGSIHYIDPGSDPQLDLALDSLNMDLYNINNIEEVEELPSHLQLNAITVGGGELEVTADADLLMNIPNFTMKLELEDVHLPDLNDFLEAYAGVDAEQGTFFLYSEMIVDEGQLEGYVQPMVEDLQILDLEDEDQGPLSTLWEGVVEGVTQIFRNQPEDQFATRVPIEGDLTDTEVGVFPGIWNIFRNAFVEAFEQSVMGEIEFDGEDESEENE